MNYRVEGLNLTHSLNLISFIAKNKELNITDSCTHGDSSMTFVSEFNSNSSTGDVLKIIEDFLKTSMKNSLTDYGVKVLSKHSSLDWNLVGFYPKDYFIFKECKGAIKSKINSLNIKKKALQAALDIANFAEKFSSLMEDRPYSNIGKNMYCPEHAKMSGYDGEDFCNNTNNNFDLLPTKGKATAIYNLMDLIRQQYEINRNENFERGADLYYVGLVYEMDSFRVAVTTDSVGKEKGLYNGMIFKFSSELNARRFRDDNKDKIMSLKSIGLFKSR